MQEETEESIELVENADLQETLTQRPYRSTAEWISFWCSSLIVGAIAGLVVFSWSTEGDRPPSLTLKPGDKIRQENQQFYVPFELTNIGGETAESVQVSAELKINGEVEESGHVEIDFLARDEKAEGAFVFNQNPDQGDLVLRVSSYKKP